MAKPVLHSAPVREADNARAIAGTALIGKACDILEIIGRAPGEVNQTILAQRTKMPRATLYRIIAALIARGLLRVDPLTQNYTLGFNFLELGQNAWSSGDLASVAAIELRRLRDLTGETAYLAVREGNSVLALGRFESAHPHRSNAKLGVLKPMYCTSQGKAMLAHLSPQQLDAFMMHERPALTPKTITDAQQLRANLAIIRARGYAVDDEEIVLGTRCVGAPILDGDGRPMAAISVAAPIYRMSAERAEQLGLEIADIAARISAQIGPGPQLRKLSDRNVEVISKAPAYVGGSPIWQAAQQSLFWIDRLAPAIYGLEAGDNGQFALADLTDSINAACLTETGALLATGNSLAMIRNHSLHKMLALPASLPITALRVAPTCEIWAAQFDEKADQTLVGRLSGDGSVAPEFTIAGRVTDLLFRDSDELLAAVPQRAAIYLCERARARIRRFTDIPKVTGMPSALALDRNGGIWVAMAEGWSVVRLDPDGNIDRTVAIPIPHPTGIAFGGPDMQQLFITSRRTGLAREVLQSAPISGHLLAVGLDVAGSAEPIGVDID